MVLADACTHRGSLNFLSLPCLTGMHHLLTALLNSTYPSIENKCKRLPTMTTLVVMVAVSLFSASLPNWAYAQKLAGSEQRLLTKVLKEMDATDLMRHLSVLAHDSMEGRESGCIGHEKALRYIKSEYRKLGLAPLPGTTDYEQRFGLPVTRWSGFECRISNVKERRYLHGRDFLVLPSQRAPSLNVLMGKTSADLPNQTLQLRWAGLAADTASLSVNISSADAANPRLLWLMVDSLDGNVLPASWWRRNPTRERAMALRRKVAGPVMIMTYRFGYWASRVGNFWDQEAHGVSTGRRSAAPIMVAGPRMSRMLMRNATSNNLHQWWPAFAPMVAEDSPLDGLMSLKLDVMARTWAIAKTKGQPTAWPWLGAKDSVRFLIEPKATQYSTANILAYLPGTDLKEEAVVISAHSDHIGQDGWHIYNGADDDGTGTAAVLAIAKQYVKLAKEGKQPRRTIIFCHFTAEEKGLLGSDHYSKNPLWPLNKTFTNLNIDMIGRSDTLHKTSGQYVYPIGMAKLSPKLEQAVRASNTLTGLELDPYYDRPDDKEHLYERSDHYNFAKHNIPVVFFFSGLHKDYHGPDDEIDHIEWTPFLSRTKLVFATSWHLANRKEALLPPTE